MKSIVLTGGGTAGHVTPNIAMIPTLETEGWDIRYIGSHDGIEKELIQAVGIRYYGISSGKLRRYLNLKNITDPFKVVKGLLDAFVLLRKLRPKVVFSKGGYVSVPVVMAAKMLGIPVIIHESDITPGLANKLAIPFAKKVCVNFPETLHHVKDKGVITGTPIRAELFKGKKEVGQRICNFANDRPTITIMGGSQGSVRINTMIRKIAGHLLPEFNIVHICGRGNIDEDFENTPGYTQFEYVGKELPHIFAITSVMISRAGANAIAEITALEIPALLIPLSLEASRGDQILNAKSMEKQGLCMVMEESNMNEVTLEQAIRNLYKQRTTYIDKMKNNQAQSGIKLVLNEIRKYSI
ncbi:MAG TPA: undecaprenyldiphospho-muramoylpentapeptide beta-N-acetylglucosaminyltransferase [Epulopiscium sp.]|nr:undecaprenyldiphospho-muramoylpentapeptide beta-N-acetylglucosaminyltransferase [Candidatus Epulonipiscium sp.]